MSSFFRPEMAEPTENTASVQTAPVVTEEPDKQPVNVKKEKISSNRSFTKILIIGIFVITALFLVWPKTNTTTQTPTNVLPPVLDYKTISAEDVKAASVYYQKRNTFKGYTPKSGGKIMWAHSGSTAVFARVDPQDPATCYGYSVVGKETSIPALDPTGGNCNIQRVKTVTEAIAASQ